MLVCQNGAGPPTSIKNPYFTKISEAVDSYDKGRKGGKGGDSHGENDTGTLKYRFCQSIALLKLDDAWHAAIELSTHMPSEKKYWLALSHKAMELMQIDLAMRVYRQLGDAGMVMALQELLPLEDKYLLAGHIYLLFSDHQRAQV